MNKKLIKKLKSVGFEQKSTWLSIILNSNEVCYFYLLGGELDIGGTSFSKKGLTFKQILAAIKEHTGVDLQPKGQEAQRRKLVIDKVKQMGLKYVDIHGKMYYHGFIGGQKATYNPRTDNFWFCELFSEDSEADINNPTVKELIELVIRYTSLDYSKPNKTKTQRIEALETECKRLEVDYDSLFDLYDKQNKNIKSLQELVKLQNEAIANLEERIESVETQVLTIEPCEHRETIKVSIPSEPEIKEQPVFKVGDEVVVISDTYSQCDNHREIVNKLIKNKTVLLVVDIQKLSNLYICNLDNKENGNTLAFKENELQHAPKKELKFGGWAEVVGNTSRHGFKTGQKVLVGALCSDDDYCCSTIDDLYYLRKEDLKPL